MLVRNRGIAAIVAFDTLLAFSLTSLVIELTPGPNMAYLAVLSAGSGRRAGFAATSGVALGLLIVGVGAALGLTALITGSRGLYEGLRWGGVLYLLWLAWEGWRGERDNSPERTEITPDDAKYFLRGLITNLLNPKAGIFYIAILPTFIDERSSIVGQAIVLSLVYVAVATIVHSTIVMLGDAARPWLEDERRNALARRALSLLLVGIAIWLFAATPYTKAMSQ